MAMMLAVLVPNHSTQKGFKTMAKSPITETTIKKPQKSQAEMRQATLEILTANPDLKAPQVGDMLVQKGFELNPKSKNFGVFVSNQRKKLGNATQSDGAKTSTTRPMTDLEQFRLARELVDIVGNLDKTVALLKVLARYHTGHARKCVDRWKGIVDAVGEQNAIKFVDAM
jgi:hypothetical protein